MDDSGEACPGAGPGAGIQRPLPVTCVVHMTIPGTWVPLARLGGDRVYWNDVDQILSGVVSSTRKRPGAWIPAFAGIVHVLLA